MRNRISLLMAVVVTSLAGGTGAARAAPVEDREEPVTRPWEPVSLSRSAVRTSDVPRSAWLLRVEGSLVGMRDSWLGLPGGELGLTVGRALTPRFAVELTGSGREMYDDERRSWS